MDLLLPRRFVPLGRFEPFASNGRPGRRQRDQCGVWLTRAVRPERGATTTGESRFYSMGSACLRRGRRAFATSVARVAKSKAAAAVAKGMWLYRAS
jgi:hypothetical protein